MAQPRARLKRATPVGPTRPASASCVCLSASYDLCASARRVSASRTTCALERTLASTSSIASRRPRASGC
eukprot:5729028-Prymnesium_polylepis.1